MIFLVYDVFFHSFFYNSFFLLEWPVLCVHFLGASRRCFLCFPKLFGPTWANNLCQYLADIQSNPDSGTEKETGWALTLGHFPSSPAGPSQHLIPDKWRKVAGLHLLVPSPLVVVCDAGVFCSREDHSKAAAWRMQNSGWGLFTAGSGTNSFCQRRGSIHTPKFRHFHNVLASPFLVHSIVYIYLWNILGSA